LWDSGTVLCPYRYRSYYYDTETSLYYLNTRYYDASIGRFINADDLSNLDANGDLEAYNLYAYCSNNPVMGYDPMGEWTFSISLGFSAFIIGGSSRSISLSFDSHGNVALQKTKADIFDEGATIGLWLAGLLGSASYTKLDSVCDLEGEGLNVGGSFNVCSPVTAGADVLLDLDTGEFNGVSVSGGVGLGLDVHASATKTETIYSYNICTYTRNMWNRFKRWIGL